MVAYWSVGSGLFLSGLVSAIETALVGIPDRVGESEQGDVSPDAFGYWRSHPGSVRTVLHVFRILGVFLYACGMIAVGTQFAVDFWGFALILCASIIVVSAVQMISRLIARPQNLSLVSI